MKRFERDNLTMKVTARHIRDCRDIDLDADQIADLQNKFNIASLSLSGIVYFETDEWTYRLRKGEDD